ncbi:MAG: hypothetical protein RL518_334 [Pseudomonadota bacterium]
MTKPKESDYRVVYTTEQGAVCPGCGNPKAKCRCADARKLEVRGDGNVRVRRETGGRGGKTVTTIAGLAMNHVELQALLKDLKRLCGAGGALKEGVIEIQGDQCELILRELGRRGVKAKRAGG